jgi:hypothetical protein
LRFEGYQVEGFGCAGVDADDAAGVKVDDNAILNFARIDAGARVEADVERIGFGVVCEFRPRPKRALGLTPFVVIPTERSD